MSSTGEIKILLGICMKKYTTQPEFHNLEDIQTLTGQPSSSFYKYLRSLSKPKIIKVMVLHRSDKR